METKRDPRYKIGDEVAFRWKEGDDWVLVEGTIEIVDRRTFEHDGPSYDVLVGYPGETACLYKHVHEADVIHMDPRLFDDEEANQ